MKSIFFLCTFFFSQFVNAIGNPLCVYGLCVGDRVSDINVSKQQLIVEYNSVLQDEYLAPALRAIYKDYSDISILQYSGVSELYSLLNENVILEKEMDINKQVTTSFAQHTFLQGMVRENLFSKAQVTFEASRNQFGEIEITVIQLSSGLNRNPDEEAEDFRLEEVRQSEQPIKSSRTELSPKEVWHLSPDND
ncbi:MAG: hypothetical protein OEY19_02245 [Gammaproteobacteria bacterium]|nr:hypothetical protein [Gammaproteobacteria bacterium]MDH5629445.1 hypothetical protein [Gammaproteobacteria bacterium]